METERDFPFFLVGHDRSGTTLLRLMLDRGEAAIPPESMFLRDFAGARRAGGLDDPGRAERLLRAVWHHPRVRLWNLPADPPSIPRGLDHQEAYRFVARAPFLAYAEREGKRRWGDKTPAYIGMLDELAETWPEARFLILVRDGRDVALSLLRVPFGANNVWAAARSWARAVRLGIEAEHRYPGRVLTVRYEELVRHPEQELPRICAFLALRYDPEMIAVERTDPGKIAAGQADWFGDIWAGVNTKAVQRWRRELTARGRRVFEGVAGRELEELGYERSVDGRLSPLEPALYAGHDALLRVVNFARLRLFRERGREVGYVLRRKLGREPRPRRFQLLVKRVADAVLALVGLLVLSPLFLAVAALILLESGRPVFFVYPRAGRHGRPFRMFKFRTMVREAIAVGRAMQLSPDPFGVVKDDPRVTRVGRWLRRTSLDELPQLANVLRGEMSLVGPRADLVEQAAHYTPEERRRLSVRPGITGWAQVHGRDRLSWPERFEKDLWYIDHWSLWLDLRIVLRTFGELLVPDAEPVEDTMNIERARAAETPKR